jgi:TetR/AcrR family transcriptional regulator
MPNHNIISPLELRTAEKRQKLRGSAATKRALLAAAKREFAAKGLEGARVHEIATRARTNKQLVYHYFGNKEGLYTAVLEEAYVAFRSREDITHIQSLSPREAVRALVYLLFDSFQELRDEVALINDENIHLGRHIKRSSRIKELHKPLIELMRDIVKRGEKLGVIRLGLDPVRYLVFLISSSSMYVSNNHTLSAVFGRDFGGQDELHAWRELVGDLVWNAARPNKG